MAWIKLKTFSFHYIDVATATVRKSTGTLLDSEQGVSSQSWTLFCLECISNKSYTQRLIHTTSSLLGTFAGSVHVVPYCVHVAPYTALCDSHVHVWAQRVPLSNCSAPNIITLAPTYRTPWCLCTPCKAL